LILPDSPFIEFKVMETSENIEREEEGYGIRLVTDSVEKDLFDQIMNQSRSMISIINRSYVYERVNDTFCLEHQVLKEDIVGRSLSDIWGEENFNRNIRAKLDNCFAGETISYEACFDTPRLGKRHYEVAFRPVVTTDSEVAYIIAETFDIHELRVSRMAALEKEEQLRQFETNIPIGFVRCLPDGSILNANKAFHKLMGGTDENQDLELNMKDFYLAAQVFELHIQQLLESHAVSFGRVFLRNIKGEEIQCRLNGFLVSDEAGLPLYIDIAVEDASRELMLENKLIQAQKLETIGALAGGIAHDFNNILATISGYSEMLREDLPADSLHSDKVAKIQNAVLKAQSIINQMLAFSRHVEQEKIAVNPAEVLRETIGFIRSSVPGDITLIDNIQTVSQHVLADPTQLFRVFINLMTNALQAMEGRGGKLSVSLEIAEGRQVKHTLTMDIVADEYFLVRFVDTGKGMDPSVMARIFEPFFTTRDVGKGTGLGLSVIHGIVTEMEGEVVVSSREEEGSVFSVYLPVARESAETVQPGAKKKILFITGDRHESRILSMAMEKSGYELLYLTDRSNLIRALNEDENSPDLIIFMVDSHLVYPEELIAIYRQMKINTPCMLISESNRTVITEKLLHSGIIKQHLIKPVSLRELKSGIQMALK